MLRPYIFIRLDTFRYDILRIRDMVYMTKETDIILSPRQCVHVFEEASPFPNVTKFIDHVDALLRLWAYRFFNNTRMYVYTNAAYQSSTYNPDGRLSAFIVSGMQLPQYFKKNFNVSYRTLVMSALSEISGSGNVVAPPAAQFAIHSQISGHPHNIPTPTISTQVRLTVRSVLQTSQTAATLGGAASRDHTIATVNTSKWT